MIFNALGVNNFFIKSGNILLKNEKNVHPNSYTTMQHSRPKRIVLECTEVGFASFYPVVDSLLAAAINQGLE